MSSVIAWGSPVGNWRCGVAASVVEVDADWAEVTVTSVWQSMGAAFDVRYCSAWVSCDGSSGGVSEGVRVQSASGVNTEQDAFSKAFRVARGSYPAAVSVAASFVMPDVQPGSSYASATVTVPAKPSVKPEPVAAVAVAVDGSKAALSWTNNADAASLKPYLGIRVEAERNGENVGSVEVAGDAIGATVDAESNSRYEWTVYPFNSAGDAEGASTGFVYTAPPAPTSVLGTFDGSAVTVTWATSARWPKHHEVWRSGDGGNTWTKLGDSTATSYKDSSPSAGTAVYRVRTIAADGTTAGAYSLSDVVPTYTGADYPSVTFGALNAAHDLPYTVAWTVGGPDAVKAQSIQVVVGGEVVQSAELAADARTFDVTAALADKSTAVVRLTVTDAKGLTTVKAASFEVDWHEPDAPNALALHHERIYGMVVATKSQPTSGHAATARFEVARDRFRLLQLSDTVTEVTFIDPVPPLGQTVEYTVTAHAANGKTATSTVSVDMPEGYGAVGFSFYYTVPLTMDMSWSNSIKHGGSNVYFAGQAYPEWYGSGEVTDTGSVSATVDAEALSILQTLNENCVPVTLRDPLGHVWYGPMQLSYTAKGKGLHDVKASVQGTVIPDELGFF